MSPHDKRYRSEEISPAPCVKLCKSECKSKCKSEVPLTHMIFNFLYWWMFPEDETKLSKYNIVKLIDVMI